MKKISNIILSLWCLFFASCIDRAAQPSVYTVYTPILMSRSSLNSSVHLQGTTAINDAAKIYHKDNFIYISERFKGVHIIDNTNPAAPVNKGFIAIPGCVDMAIKNNVLYADNAIDLVSINLSEAEKGKLQLLKRVENVFPEVVPPDGGLVPDKFSERNRPENTIIISWKK